MPGIRLPRSGLRLPFVIPLTTASQKVLILFHLIQLSFTKNELFGELDPFGSSFSWECCGSKGLSYEPPAYIFMSFSCTRSIWKVSLFSHCARKKLQQLPRSRFATFQTSSLQRTRDVSTWMCLFPTWSHTEFSANMARGSPQLFQCLCTAVFSTGNVTGTAGPQILTCPALGPNALRKADCTTLSLSAQADTCINTTNKTVTTIIQ